MTLKTLKIEMSKVETPNPILLLEKSKKHKEIEDKLKYGKIVKIERIK